MVSRHASTITAALQSSGANIQFALNVSDLDVAIPDVATRGSFVHRVLTGSRLPSVDPVKRWDAANVAAFVSVLPLTSAALDCGAYNSPVPLMLAAMGFETVHGIDLNPHAPWMPTPASGASVQWSCQNIVATAFESNSFDLVTCCSTIEHGVDWDAFLNETGRLLRPGGWLYLSTDLVPDDAPNNDGTAFGLPWWPLRPRDLNDRVEQIRAHGFSIPDVEPFVVPEQLPIEFLGQRLGFVAFTAQFGAPQ